MIKEDIISLLSADTYKLFVRKAGKYKFQSNYKFVTHKHPEIEINYINTGCCVMEIGNDYVPLKAGDCVVVMPSVLHSFMVDISRSCSITQLEYIMTVPRELEIKTLFQEKEKDYYHFDFCDNLCKSLENVGRIFREQKEEDVYSSMQLELALAQMQVAFEGQYQKVEREKVNEPKGVMGEVIRYINQHIKEELRIENIAKKYHISDRYIRKYFHTHLEMNCTTYISLLRIAKAKEMLWNTDKSITEIAMQMGFSSSQYFSRVFFKYTEMTPQGYRKMWRGTTAEV